MTPVELQAEQSRNYQNPIETPLAERSRSQPKPEENTVG